MRLFKKRSDKNKQKGDFGAHGKIYQAINSFAMTGVFIIAGVIILSIFGTIQLTSTIVGLCGTVIFLCIAAMLTLPWVKWIEKKQHKKLAIIFICLIATCCILWTICLWLGISLYRQFRDGATEETRITLINTIKIIQISLVISLQFLIASAITNGIIKYKKTYITFQSLSYASYLYLDFYITTFLLCLTFATNADGNPYISIANGITILTHTSSLILLAIAAVFMAISNGFMKKLEKSRSQNIMEKTIEYAEQNQFAKENNTTKAKEEQEESIDKKLEQLKALLDKQLISQEEYDQKRKELLGKFWQFRHI